MKKIYDVKSFIVNASIPVLTALKQLSSKPHGEQFLLIVDDKGRLKGTLTDGDVRRALISGKIITGLVSDFMHQSPKFVVNSVATVDINKELNDGQSPAMFLPVLNSDLTVNHIILEEERSSKKAYALVMAGGFGKRLGQSTSELPKPLVKVGGVPLIEHVLKRIESLGVSHIFISVHYLAEMVEAYVEASGRKGYVSILNEEKPLGTAGSIAMLPFINDGNLIVTNCDLISNLNYNNMLNFHIALTADATIAVATHKVQIPFGVIRYDNFGGFEKIEEKPILSNYVAAGIYIFSSKFIRSHRIRGHMDMPDYISHGKSKGMRPYVFPLYEEWADIGRPEDLERSDFESLT